MTIRFARSTTLLAAITSVAVSVGANASPNDRAWPSVMASPALDVPMRDTAITRALDGACHLTGTLQGAAPSGVPDFDKCLQSKLWKMGDLKAWEEAGVAWDHEGHGWSGTSGWILPLHGGSNSSGPS